MNNQNDQMNRSYKNNSQNMVGVNKDGKDDPNNMYTPINNQN